MSMRTTRTLATCAAVARVVGWTVAAAVTVPLGLDVDVLGRPVVAERAPGARRPVLPVGPAGLRAA
ncbi:hypothetical protein [Modestobacter roseus]|uniref:Uncharacterized protein n=1 Tax=Modestobacter roseus TaxID=1181884 RepID=A0A562IR07_9ACTN|nr:hypothetical protein [Modestobacter roseus]MQA32028.1 hypothetical protein [Modestobacter roseus]TWH73441.1 hypothetical protein JD78_01964 [Modestobacter roseus]